MRYVPPDLKIELERLKRKLYIYEVFKDNPKRLQGHINKLKIDIKNYEQAIEDITKAIAKEAKNE